MEVERGSKVPVIMVFSNHSGGIPHLVIYAEFLKNSQGLPTSRGGPIRTGWNSTAAASVQTSERASSLPMLEVPGWLDSQRLPNAVPVVMALKITARVRGDCNSPV